MNNRVAIRFLILCLFVCTMTLAACTGRVYVVESQSMQPSLNEGDHVTVYPVELSGLKHGDVVVYVSPMNEEKFYLKRVIALPGERIEIKDGAIYLNDRALIETYPVVPMPATLQFAPLMLDLDEYFVLGDNRPASHDSRFQGPISAQLIKGRASIR